MTVQVTTRVTIWSGIAEKRDDLRSVKKNERQSFALACREDRACGACLGGHIGPFQKKVIGVIGKRLQP